MGRGMTPDRLEQIEKRPVGYSDYVTAYMCTTSAYHNDAVTELTLREAGYENIGEYPSNKAHPGIVKIWLKKLPHGVATGKPDWSW
mgnify:CR=1 FL=1